MAAAPSIMQVIAITTVFGNVNVEKSLRNVVAMFHILWKEMAWRKGKDKSFSYGAFQSFKPVVSLGSGHALGQPVVVKTNGRPYGQDGLWNFHALYPEFTPDDSWKSLFDQSVPPPDKQPEFYQYFNASRAPSHLDILRILRDEPANTITLIALGPLTNMALAAAEDPETFLRAKELLIMGGAISVPGNISPVPEANAYNDAAAAARTPLSTLAYTFMEGIHDNCDKDCIFLEGTNEECITLHGPVPVRYALEKDFWNISAPSGLCVESLGQWAKGMQVEYQINMTDPFD
ncbi:related to inosine-uridine preferring nucleoside hydrolase [Fusarium fujikuroi]|nr:related to inosine-uridine preferring nucleoside hydrolase [Fusarium fujikuroi]SCO11130.1 related to inosine-uridine preferring nucleoside hydrolase [Fusarium fujikuroi]SCO40790.1 related to inosine-uridine preferring nucleoside hydrolase [Fusarium fujikuroi]SCV57842.1 related to inosine-uridine preferring nucleoside hydrolase [Fusarium fujikuroi]